MYRILFLSFLIFYVSNLGYSQQNGRQTEEYYYSDPSVGDGKIHGYLLYLPPGYEEKSSTEFPLLIFLHGAGERGELDYNSLRRHGPAKLIEQGWDFPFIVASPQTYKYAGGWEPKVVDEFLEKIKAEHRVDDSKVYVTGISMGGAGTWNYVINYPEKVAACVPICGWANVPSICNMVDVPVWAFHNEGDKTVGVGGTKNAISNLKNCSPQPLVEPQMIIYPTGGHDAWTKTYNKSAGHDIYSWMLQYSKPQPVEENDPVVIQQVQIDPGAVDEGTTSDVTITANIEGDIKEVYADISQIANTTDIQLTRSGDSYTCAFKTVSLAAGSKNVTIKVVDSMNEIVSKTTTLEVKSKIDTIPPSIPVVTDNSFSYTGITVAWNASTDNTGLKNYKIYVDGSFKAKTNKLSYSITGLSSATTYAIGVSAEDMAGNESEKSTVQVTTLNRKPFVYAGSDDMVVLPTKSIFLRGNGSDSDGSIASIQWVLESGPNKPIIENKASFETKVNNLIEGIYIFQLTVADNLGESASDEIQVTVKKDESSTPPRQTFLVYRINSGGGLLEADDMDWQNDYRLAPSPYFSSKSANASTGWNYFPYAAPADKDVPRILFGTYRYGTSWGDDIEYNIPVGPGKYVVNLYFAEDRNRGVKEPGQRVFNVFCENQLRIDQLDIYAEAELDGLVKSLDVTVEEGDKTIDISLVPIKGLTLINGIEVLSFEESVAKKNFESLAFGKEMGNEIGIKIHPNPVNDLINLSFDQFVEGHFKISILNTAGTVMYSQDRSLPYGLSETALDISDFNFKPGIYFIYLQLNGQTFKQLKFYKL